MAEGIDALTDKEKETLHLMLRGHDAKSMARTLDLSVHTINDRLRAARRKLSVTSSREAARLLFDAESSAHENSAPKDLGGALASKSEDRASPLSQNSRVPTSGRRGMALVGGIVLMTALAFFVAALLLGSTELAPPTDQAAETVELEQAETVALAWLDLIDQDDSVLQPSEGEAAAREDPNLEGWFKTVDRRREFGRAIRRETQRIDIIEKSGNDEWIVRFRTDFESFRGAYEKVTLTRIDGAFIAKDYAVE